MEVVEESLGVVGSNVLGFSEDDILLPVDGSDVQLRVLGDIGKDLDELWHVLVESVGLEGGLFTRGVGVEGSTEVLDFELELVLGSGGRSLERQVLMVSFRTVFPMPWSSSPLFRRVSFQ